MPEIEWLHEDDCAKGMKARRKCVLGLAWRHTSRIKNQGVQAIKVASQRTAKAKNPQRPSGREGSRFNERPVTFLRPEAGAI